MAKLFQVYSAGALDLYTLEAAMTFATPFTAMTVATPSRHRKPLHCFI